MIKSSKNLDANNLYKQLGGEDNLIEEEYTSDNDNDNDNVYQLPIRIGVSTSGSWAELGNDHRPWIVGRFSPNQATDKNHPQGHKGVDLKAPRNTPVYPIAQGKVVVSHQEDEKAYIKGSGGTIGSYVAIVHENGKVRSMYGHLLKVNVREGQEVDQNTVIGFVGQSGNAYGRGDHLHYEVKINGSYVNPLNVTGKEVGKLSKSAGLKSYIFKTAELFLKLSSMTEAEAYKKLDLPNHATLQDINSKFRNLSKEHHPDRGGNQKVYQEISEAYHVLKDKQNCDKRNFWYNEETDEEYDEWIKACDELEAKEKYEEEEELKAYEILQNIIDLIVENGQIHINTVKKLTDDWYYWNIEYLLKTMSEKFGVPVKIDGDSIKIDTTDKSLLNMYKNIYKKKNLLNNAPWPALIGPGNKT